MDKPDNDHLNTYISPSVVCGINRQNIILKYGMRGHFRYSGAVIPATLGASQTSSTMSSLLAAPEPSLPSNTTSTKLTLDVLEPADTPQSTRNNAHDQVLVYI